jgi:hypothetical protein
MCVLTSNTFLILVTVPRLVSKLAVEKSFNLRQGSHLLLYFMFSSSYFGRVVGGGVFELHVISQLVTKLFA